MMVISDIYCFQNTWRHSKHNIHKKYYNGTNLILLSLMRKQQSLDH